MAKKSNTQFKTHDQVIRLPITGKPYEAYRDTSERGTGRLGVRVSAKGSKTWMFRYFIDSKPKFISIGSVSEKFTMLKAADIAESYSSVISQGLDPKIELEKDKKQQATAEKEESLKGSIKQLFQAYADQMKREGKRTYAKVLKDLEKETYSFIAPATKAKEVKTDEVKLILAAMIKRGAPTQSNRVRSYLLAAFNNGLRHDNDPASLNDNVLFGLTSNPVAIIPRQKDAEKVGENYLLLPEIKELLVTFQQAHKVGELFANLLKLTFYTGGQRPYELAASEWSAIDWDERTWLITKDISKNKREHMIPLTDTAVDILHLLKEQAKDSKFIFPKHRTPHEHARLDSFSQSIGYYRKANPEFKPFIPRDIRRTCKTLMGELGVSKEIRDRLQNHAFSDVSSRHYDRFDYLPEKRHALESWESRLNEVAVKNVVNLRG
jgi:integrase